MINLSRIHLIPLTNAAGLVLAVLISSHVVSAETEATRLETIRVLGSGEENVSVPTAPQSLSKEKMESFKFTDVNRALKQISGVYVREEEGQGLRPNIGLRGTNPDRSKKIVLLEDNILIGPAPYSAPAAYYTPSMTHVESLEIFKGFIAVPYGPNSVGGAINYVSRAIPSESLQKIELSAGAFSSQTLKATIGNQENWGGYALDLARLTTQGFKKLDGGGDTGFVVHDVSSKFRYLLNESDTRPQHIELRLGYADQISNETYLGLSASDFNQEPYRRYSSSALDKMQSRHSKVQLEHLLALNEASLVTTTLYRHDFHRAWYRLDRFRDTNVTLSGILKDPTSGANQAFYDVLRGAADTSSIGFGGELIITNNDRTYYSQGIQSKLSTTLASPSITHEVDVTLRIHQDEIRRDHDFDLYEMTSGRLIRTVTARQRDKENQDRASAQSLSVQNNMSLGRWVITAAARAETVKFENNDFLLNQNHERGDSVFVPGLGALYKVSEDFSLRVSANAAATVAGLDPLGNEAKEESTNYELGAKWYDRESQRHFDFIYFYNDYRNITGTCTISSGCNSSSIDEQFNGGAALITGLEARIAQGFMYRGIWFPVQLNGTWIQGQFRSNFSSQNPEWGLGEVRNGDPLPYVPDFQYAFTFGTEYGRFKQDTAIIFQGRMFDQSVQVNREEVPSYGVVDWSGRYELNESSVVFAKADNLLGRDYVAALRPFGYRPGKPRSFMVGLSYAF